MLNSFNFAIEHGAFHRDQKTSLISLLLNKGKDTLDCSSYRPISLISCDVKIYAKVFASPMEMVIHSLIKEDQTGFIKGCNASDNMRRLLHILDFADSHPTPCAVFSLDAEKAFDRLDWNDMWAVLQCFGFGEHFVSMIKTFVTRITRRETFGSKCKLFIEQHHGQYRQGRAGANRYGMGETEE